MPASNIGVLLSLVRMVIGFTFNDINYDPILMNIEIDKLNLNRNIYEKDSVLNNIDKNIIILKESDLPNKEKSLVLIGAHSGYGEIAYFNNLDKLINGDVVKLIYKNKIYKYKVINKYLDDKKDGISINYNVLKRRLILYTCNPRDKNNFLIVVSEEF